MGPTKSREFVRVKFEGGGRAGPLASGSCGQGGGRGAGHGCHDARLVESIQILEYQTDMRRCRFDTKPSSLL